MNFYFFIFIFYVFENLPDMHENLYHSCYVSIVLGNNVAIYTPSALHLSSSLLSNPLSDLSL